MTVNALWVDGPMRGTVQTLRAHDAKVVWLDEPILRAALADDAPRPKRHVWSVETVRLTDRSWRVIVPDMDERSVAQAILALIDADPEAVRAVEVPR